MIVVLITVIAALYVSVFFTLGLFVSAATKKAFTSLFLCLFLWVVAILIIPNLAPVMGRILAPTPSPRKIEAEKEAVSREIELRIDRLYWATDGSSVSGDEMDREMEKLREEGATRRNRWDRFLEQAQLSQTRISEVLGRLSPSSSWIFSAYSLIKAGPVAYRNITDGRNRLKKDLEDQWQGIEQYWRRNGKPPELKPEELPNLKIQFYDTNRAVAGALNDVLLLIIFNALFFMAAFLFFLRYDVR
jgi:ABC-type transport system involved in multi-copper enzyme maturation permease subunit